MLRRNLQQDRLCSAHNEIIICLLQGEKRLFEKNMSQ